MHRTRRLSLGFVFAALTVCPPASAGMYRCGNTFQDHPCAGEPGKVMNSGTSSSGGMGSYAECSLRGEKAQKIAWIRETGVMEDKQQAGTKNYADKKLIQEVYLKKGTAVEIRAAIEADCRDEKDRALQAAALRSLANQISGSPSPGAPQQRGGM